MIEVCFAVISDLHCHHSRNFNKGDANAVSSYLTTDTLRIPVKKHPVQSLLTLIKEDTKITSKYVLCPGDITNRVDVQGFISGWDFINEISAALKAEDIYATLGNHDVDSRYNLSDDVFSTAQGIGKDYPFKDPHGVRDFWSNGYCFVEKADMRLLIVNTVKFHTSKENSVKGKMDDKQLEGIEEYLNKVQDDKVQVVLCHHHPIPHERFNLGSEDVIELGSKLVTLINKFKFDLLVHGHKHDPWLRYSGGNGESVPIFSSGSFSATTNTMHTGAKNTFHLIRLTKEPGKRACGLIKTWEYLPTEGWRKADSGDHYFPQLTGFGYSGSLDDLVKQTEQIIADGNGAFLPWSELKSKLRSVEYLTPDECIEFRNKLQAMDIITNPELPREPNTIGKTSKAI